MNSYCKLCLPVLLLGATALPVRAAQSAPPAHKQDARQNIYQHWQTTAIKTLAARDDADSLYAAALLERLPATDADGNMHARETHVRAHAMQRSLDFLDQAASLEPDGADIAAQALIACSHISGCDINTYADRYNAAAPNDAFGWWPALQQAQADKNQTAITENLLAMSHAATFTDYFVSHYQRLRRGLDQVPPPPAASTPSSAMGPTSAGNRRAVVAMAVASAITLPPYGTVSKPCRPDNAQFAQRHEACLAIGKLMQRGAHTMVGYQIGLVLQRRAADNDADRQNALAVGRRLDWQLHNYHEKVSQSVGPDRAAAQRRDYFDALEQTGGELSAIQLLLNKAGLPLDPPADWVDKTQQAQLENEQHMLDPHQD